MPFITPAQSKTRDQFPLSPKKIIKKTVTGTIGYSILFLILFVVSSIALLATKNFSFVLLDGLIFLILLLAVLIAEYTYQKWYFTVYFYDLTESFIIIKKGVFTPKEISVPYERVQDIYMDQDIFDRFFGLYDAHISSATISSGFEAHIDGVEKQAADGLKNLLLSTVQEKIKRAPHPQPQPEQSK